MSADTKTKKRKSGDNAAPTAKKVKTSTAATKSADRPAPLKSALKKVKTEKIANEKPKSKKGKAAATTVEHAVKLPAKGDIVHQEKEEDEVEDEDDDEEGGAELSADRTAALLAGFSSDSDDDGDEDGDGDAEDDGIAISKLPAAPALKAISKTTTTVAGKDGAGHTDQEADPESTPGVIFISRIPHGFYEKQMHAYFAQFGTITHLRLARNRKTGRSKHFAFVEFAAAAVADIVARTMDKYLLFGHILQVRRVPREQVRDGLWKSGAKGAKAGKVRPRNRIEGSKLRKGMQREGWEKRISREDKRREDKAVQLKELGYEFAAPAVKRVSEVPFAAKVIQDADAVEGGVLLLQGKKTEVEPGVEETVETVVEAVAVDADASAPQVTVTEKTIKRKKSKDVSAATTTTKKRKSKLAAAAP